MYKAKQPGGFTFTELLVTIAIMLILGALTISTYSQYRIERLLSSEAARLVALLESTKASSLAGKGNESQGIKFNASSFETFSGSSYAGGSDIVVFDLDPELLISTTLSGDEEIVFSRLTGWANDAATITIAVVDDLSVYKQIEVGTAGEIHLRE